MEWHGTGLAPGVAQGRCLWLVDDHMSPSEIPMTGDLWRWAVDAVRADLLQRQSALPSELAALIEVQLLILDDEDINQGVVDAIGDGASPQDAWRATFNDLKERFEALELPLFRERLDDIRDVGQQILTRLGARGQRRWPADGPAVLVAERVLPSDLLGLDTARLQAVVVGEAGPTSHVVIVARGLGVPLVAVGSAVAALHNGLSVVVDGGRGVVAEARGIPSKAAGPLRPPVAAGPATTRDGVQIQVMANAGRLEDVRRALENGADGVGLLRMEFLLEQESSPPSARRIGEWLQPMVDMLEGRPLVVRLPDIGGDKPVPYLSLPAETNPFLGRRAIRLWDAYPMLFDHVLEAVNSLRFTSGVRLMVPMVADLEDWWRVRLAVQQVVDTRRILLGAMVEVPSAVLLAPELAREAAFLSLGTNDLIQYLFAADRTASAVASYYRPYHPAVLRAIDMVGQAAHREGCPVAVCGEMAGDVRWVPLLVGLGVQELSVSPDLIGPVKARVAALHRTGAEAVVREAVRMTDGAAVLELLADG